MSINKLVSIKNPILNAMDLAGMDNGTPLPLFMTWAYEAETEIDSYYQYIRQWAVLDICGPTAQLPDNCIKVEAAIMGIHNEANGNVFNALFNNLGKAFSTSVDNTFTIVDSFSPESGTYSGIMPYSYQNNKLIFDRVPNQTNVTIQYIGYSVDCDGYMEVSQNHVKAITHYILYNWTLRNRKKTGADMQEMQWHYKEWDRLCAHSRALDSQLTETEREEIARLWHNPYSGRGLFVGNNINGGYGRIGY